MTTPEETAKATGKAIAYGGRAPIMWPETYVRGAELGFDGFDFYMYGRGAALGLVDADVVAAAMAFFSPSTVRKSWEAGLAVLPPDQAALEWAGCIHAWARENVPDDLDAARLAELAGPVIEGAGAWSLPLFAGWRRLPEPEPEDSKALAAHRLNSLRELRGGLHGLAVRTVGLAPIEAIVVHDVWMGSLFGWPEPWPDPEPYVERRREAERLTNEMMAIPLSALTEPELTDLTTLINQLNASINPS